MGAWCRGETRGLVGKLVAMEEWDEYLCVERSRVWQRRKMRCEGLGGGGVKVWKRRGRVQKEVEILVFSVCEKKEEFMDKILKDAKNRLAKAWRRKRGNS